MKSQVLNKTNILLLFRTHFSLYHITSTKCCEMCERRSWSWQWMLWLYLLGFGISWLQNLPLLVLSRYVYNFGYFLLKTNTQLWNIDSVVIYCYPQCRSGFLLKLWMLIYIFSLVWTWRLKDASLKMEQWIWIAWWKNSFFFVKILFPFF